MSAPSPVGIPPQRLIDLGNPLVRAVLRSPLHPALDHAVLILHIVGAQERAPLRHPGRLPRPGRRAGRGHPTWLADQPARRRRSRRDPPWAAPAHARPARRGPHLRGRNTAAGDTAARSEGGPTADRLEHRCQPAPQPGRAGGGCPTVRPVHPDPHRRTRPATTSQLAPPADRIARPSMTRTRRRTPAVTCPRQPGSRTRLCIASAWSSALPARGFARVAS